MRRSGFWLRFLTHETLIQAQAKAERINVWLKHADGSDSCILVTLGSAGIPGVGGVERPL